MSGEPWTLLGLSEPALMLRLVELVLAVSLLELLWFLRRSGPLARRQGLPNLIAGLSLILALRLGLGGAGLAWVAACLLTAGVSHLLDLQARQRLMQGPEAVHRSPPPPTQAPRARKAVTVMSTRRHFITWIPLAGSTLIAGQALAQPMVEEKDPVAASLGYAADASKVDKAKFPKYAAGQACSNCAVYQGKAGAAAGPCPIFSGKQVSAKGWCSAYAKKA